MVLLGCGLTLDLTPPEEDGGTVDAARRDASLPDASVDGARPDVVADATMCTSDDECFRPDCVIRACEMGRCVARGGVACMPIDDCHEPTGTCSEDGSCDQALIDEDGDGYAPIELSCGDDCDDAEPSVHAGGVCARDADDDGYGSMVDFTTYCGDVTCEGGYVNDRSDCWDADRDGIDPGEPDPRVANPALGDVFFDFERGNGGFDWNCDEEITTSHGEAIFARCEGTEEMPGACRAQSGWAEEVPGCGESADWVSCRISPEDGASCEAFLILGRVQGCR